MLIARIKLHQTQLWPGLNLSGEIQLSLTVKCGSHEGFSTSQMQSLPMEVGSSSSSGSAPSDTSGSMVQVCFPSAQASVLDSLNRQREDGRLCDLSIHVQGQVFKAHRCVLAASSPYFHDQVLLKNMSTVSIPAVMDPLAFESVLSCAYTGQLRMLREDIVNYLTVGSVLQMWHIVDKCTELLKEGRAAAGGGTGGGGGGVRPSVSESQSPSSTNYFSPRDGSSFGGGSAATAGASVDGGGASNTPSYCTPSGGEEAFLIEEEEDEDGEDSALPPQKRPTYSQPSIMPRKQWVVVKTERTEDDDLIVVSGEEGGEDEEDEDEREVELARERERSDFNISNVRSLSFPLPVCLQMDYCQSSEDYLKFEGSLMDQTLVQSAATARAQLFPLDMQGNQILLYSQASGLSLDAAAPPLGMAGGMIGAASFKGPGGGGSGGSNSGTGGSGKVFMCHCGKTFTHKSMRDRHINMHLDLRPFHCPVCAKKFKMKHHLTEHMKTHTGLKPYDCLGCGKKFMWRDSFMRHRSHCERRSGLGESGEGGSGGEGGRRGGGGGDDGSTTEHIQSVYR
uniref:Zinc finger and BTB domain containing 22b n=1 Tax=Seriola lalandi dorsalis TaxID=1841481 RepID=A0A3B4Y9P3_SERLL